MSITPSFQGEVQFRRYSDTSTQGQQIVFAVADREALEPFIGKEGKRFMAVFVEVGDDELPVTPAPRKNTRGPLCREACDYCEMPEFQSWVAQTGEWDMSEAEAKDFILTMCEIKSRKELDSNRLAGETFIHSVRVPFMHWKRERMPA
jgi:hypothetical protein